MSYPWRAWRMPRIQPPLLPILLQPFQSKAIDLPQAINPFLFTRCINPSHQTKMVAVWEDLVGQVVFSPSQKLQLGVVHIQNTLSVRPPGNVQDGYIDV